MPADLKIRILDGSGRAVYDGSLIRIALTDEAIKAKSIEFFRDPEPCMIHRSAVMTRLYGEMMEYFDERASQGRRSDKIAEMPEWFLRYLDLPGDAVEIEFSRPGAARAR